MDQTARKLNASTTTGTYTHANGTGEADSLEFLAQPQDLYIRFDMNNITQNTTVREYEKVDGTNYRLLDAKIFPSDFDINTKAISFSFKQANRSYKITFQSAVAEGSGKSVPYIYRTENRG